MFKNYLIVAFRHIVRQRIFSAINIFGLAVGISSSLIIYLLVNYDFSFDKFHKNGDRIYRVVSKFNYAGETFYNSGVTFPLSGAVAKQVTGIETIAPFYTLGSDLRISINGNNAAVFRNQSNTVYAGPEYFRLFEYEWLAGSPQTALNQPYRTVLTEKKAALYFPGLSAAQIIGQQLILNDTMVTTVSGIIREFKGNTDFTFSAFVSWPTLTNKELQLPELKDWSSTNSASQLFIKLAAGQQPEQIEKKLAGIFDHYAPPGNNGKKEKSPFLLQPLTDVHFNANYGTYFDNRMANKATLYGLLVIAAFILLLACINFINLSTAMASHRAKEIGIRKTVGGGKKHLIGQFLTETFVLTLLSTVLSVLLTPFILQAVKDFVPQPLLNYPFSGWEVWLFLIALTVTITLLAGFYPSLILSRFPPVRILQNRFVANNSSSGLLLRKALTTTQFVIAQVFIVAVTIAGMQLHYSLTKDPGFRHDAIIHFQTNYYDTIGEKKFVLQEKIKSIPGVEMVSLSTNPPAATGTWSSTIKYKQQKKETETHVQIKMGDSNYLKLYDLRLLAGRNIRTTDSVEELIINQTYAALLGFSEPREAIGKRLFFNEHPVPVVGVIADFHQQSLHAAIHPLVIGSWPQNQRTINVALTGEDLHATVGRIGKAFKEIYPENDFEYSFQNDTIRSYYDNEIKTAYLLKCATAVTIIISSLGLLGLTIYSTRRRTKELGIRKVLGASVLQIITLLTKDLLLLLIIGFIIATPISWWAMTEWLQNFAYRTPITWWIFGLTLAAQLLFALFTVGIQTIRSAAENPVNSLKTE